MEQSESLTYFLTKVSALQRISISYIYIYTCNLQRAATKITLEKGFIQVVYWEKE